MPLESGWRLCRFDAARAKGLRVIRLLIRRVRGSAARSNVPSFVAAFAFSAFSTPALAQPPTDDVLFSMSLEELMNVEINIATGRGQSLMKAPAVATVVTAEEIRAIGATTLDEVLETIPGVHISTSYINYNPMPVVRGIFEEGSQPLLMLLNGIPINSIYSGQDNIRRGTPVNTIARIEMIRGPGSAVYGADAFSGVLNIVTKTAQDINGLEVGARAGSFDTRDAWLLYGGTWKGFEIAFMSDFRRSDGHRATVERDIQSTFDQLTGTDASLAPGPAATSVRLSKTWIDIAKENFRLRLGYSPLADYGTGAGIAQALDPQGRMAGERVHGDLTYEDPHFTPDWQLKVQASYYQTSQEVTEPLLLFPPGANFGAGAFPQGVIGAPEAFERQYRGEIAGIYSGWKSNKVRVGAGYLLGELYEVEERKNFVIDPNTGVPVPLGMMVDVSDTEQSFVPERSRENHYLFLQNEWTIAQGWDLTAGVRYDNYSDFGETTNPRFALVWRPREHITTKLLYGQAFRAPTVSELYNRNNPVGLGNPDLKPERIETVELAFGYLWGNRSQTNLSLFRYHWRDMISFGLDPEAGGWATKNMGTQTGYGAEVETVWQWTKALRMMFNFAYQNSDSEENLHAERAPTWLGYARLNWRPRPQWSVTPQVRWVAGRGRGDGDPREEVDDYTLADLTVRREGVFRKWEFAFSVRNILDTDAREPSPGPNSAGIVGIPDDLPGAGRSAYGEVRYHF